MARPAHSNFVGGGLCSLGKWAFAVGAHVMVNSSPKTSAASPQRPSELTALPLGLSCHFVCWRVVAPIRFAQSLCSPEVGSEWVSFFPLGTELTLRESPHPMVQGSPEPGSSCMHPMRSNQSFPCWVENDLLLVAIAAAWEIYIVVGATQNELENKDTCCKVNHEHIYQAV